MEAHHLGAEPVPVGVAEVHPEQVTGEERGLVATRARPDLQDDVPVVVRIARQQVDGQALELGRLGGLEASDLLAGHRLHLVVVLRVPHLPGAGKLLADRLQAPVRRDDRLQARQLPAEPPQRVHVR